MQRLIKTLVLSFVLSRHASTQAAPPDKHHEVQVSPGHTLKLWFKPKYGWRAKSYDQRYPGCTRQQEHRVYTADAVGLPRMLNNPRNLHWLTDPQQAGQKALYIGQLGLAGGMPPSKRVMGRAKKDLGAIWIQATEQDKMRALQRALAQAQAGADFDSVYDQVFGEGSSEEIDLAIFDLTVGEVRELGNYSMLFPFLGEEQSQEQSKDAEKPVMHDEAGVVLSPTDLVDALYSPVESQKHQDVCRILRSKKYEAAYGKVLPLAAGLLYKSYVDGKDPQAYGLGVFWSCVLSDPQELVGIHQIALNMHCMEACGADAKGVLKKLHKPILNNITSWVLAAWGVKPHSGGWGQPSITTGPLLSVLEKVWCACPCVLSYGPLAQGALSRLREWKKLPRMAEKAAIGTLARLARLVDGAWPPAISKALLDNVLAGCKHGSWEVRQAAAGACAQALEIQCSEEGWQGILEALTRLCKDSDHYVRQAAAEGLSKVLETQCSEEAWNAKVQALKDLSRDGGWYVRSAAAEGLSKGLSVKSEKAVWHAILEILTGLCKDEDWYVRKTAAWGLSRGLEGICSEEAWHAILETLTGLCRDEHFEVCEAAAGGLSKALGGKCSQQAWQGRVQAFMPLCKDEHWQVREAGARGLSKGLEHPCSDEVWKTILEVLMPLCKDEHWKVRRASASACSKGLETQCSDEGWQAIVETLTFLCKDSDHNVGKEASEGLSKVLEGACSEEAWKGGVQALVRLCKDEHTWVRCAGAEGLSKALKGACSEEAWKGRVRVLADLCKDEHTWVRCAGAVSLSNALEGACSEEGWQAVVEALKSFCKEDSEWVRQAAVGALPKGVDGKCSKEAWQVRVEALKGLCKDEDHSVRRAVAESLSKALEAEACSEKDWQGIVEALAGLCKDKNPSVRQAGAVALSKALEGGTCSEEGWQGILEALACLLKDRHVSVRQAAEQALVQAMGKQELLVRTLMRSESPSLNLIEAIATYNTCLILLPAKCDPKVSERIQRAFSQERKKRGWPEALLSVRDLPPMASLSKQAGNKTDAPSKEGKSMSK